MSERNDDRGTGTTDEQPPDDRFEELPLDRRDLLKGSVGSWFGVGAFSGLSEGSAPALGDDVVSPNGEANAETRPSREFTVLLTNFESKWTDGWTSVNYFEAGGNPYFFLLKESNGRVNIHSVKDHNGYFNSDIERNDWASGWTSVEFYEVDDQPYLFLLKEGDGEVHIHEMNDDGTVGTYKFKHNWASGWTSVEFYEAGGQPYLFLLKESDGTVHIHEMNDDGSVGRMTHDIRTETDWTSVESYEMDGRTYLFLLKESDGTAHVHEMTGGRLDGRIHSYDWASGWTSVEFYEAGGDTYLFLLKESDGTVHIHGMNDDGSVRPLKFYADWTSGWTDATFYRPNSKGKHHCQYWPEDTTYLSLLKESNGEGHLHEINEDGSVGRRLNPDEPEPPSYYEDLITEAGLGKGLVADYWRTVSHGNMDLRGSNVYGWITIQKTWEEVKSNGRGDQIDASMQAAENASGPPSNLPDRRIIAIHSEPPESGAHSRRILAHPFATGVTFFTHEMGHCFDDKLPHTASNLQPGTYDDPWDVMSAMEVCRSVYAEDEPEGPIGPGLNAYNISDQGWFRSTDLEVVDPSDQMSTVRTIKSLSKPFENSGETLVLQVNTPYDPDDNYHYYVELRTPHGFDRAMEEPVVLIHLIDHHHKANNEKPSRVLRRTHDQTYPDVQGWSKRRPFSYVFDDKERIGITALNVQETILPEGGEAEIYVAKQPGNVRLHRLDRERVGGEIGRHDWASGWTNVEFYEVDGQPYLFLLKEGDGEVHIHEMNDDGTVGTYKFKHNWASGWTSVEFYEAGGQPYLFLLKESDGTVHIHEMNANGNVGPMTTNTSFGSGWTSAEFLDTGGDTYLFLLNESDGTVEIHEMNGGSIAGRNQTYNWASGWTSAEFYEAGGQPYLFLLKESDGTVYIRGVNDDGTVGNLEYAHNWTSGWTSVDFYEVNDQPFLFLLKESDGTVEVHEMNDDGNVGKQRHTRNWSSGWTTATVYRVDDAPHLFLLKERGT